jgi:hypothetical protein
VNYFKVPTSVAGCPINLVGEKGQAIQISIHSPSPYICANLERILPDWKNQSSSMWVIIVLQRSHYELVEKTAVVEAEKQLLREQFMRFGLDVSFNLRDRGYLTDLIDPRTGYPLLSCPGQIPHDDTAAVQALLDYPIIKNECRVLVHPDWGTAVYPSILISQAPPILIEWMVRQISCLK